MTTIIIVLSKKGFKDVTLKQGVYSDGQKWYTSNENGIERSLKNAYCLKMLGNQYLNAGWTVKSRWIAEAEKPEEQALAAPKEPKPKKTRAEALEERYGDIETRRAYMAKKNAKKAEVTREVKAEIVEWVKSHRRLTKDEYKDQLNKEVSRRMSQWKAETEACIG